MLKAFLIYLVIIYSGLLYAQENPDIKIERIDRSGRINSDTLKNDLKSTFLNDTNYIKDSLLLTEDTLSNNPDINTNTVPDTSRQVISDIDEAINYSATDSLVFDMKSNKINLYNEAKLTYKDLKLESGKITVDQETQILEAYGIPDTVLTGKFNQPPLMFQGNDKYEGSKLSYNFETQQGNVSMGFSDAEIGYYFGDKIKKVSSEVLFIKNGLYTTSTDRENPEYYFLSPKMKVIPNDKVIAQSVFVYIEGVPVFWLPFGVFPNRSGRSSGLIPPKFGDDATYGQYFSRLGYFWAINDYTDAALTGSYFTKGRVDLYGRFRYVSRYNYSGSVEGGYSKIRLGESTDIGTQNSDAWNISVNHNQQINPTSRFDAGLTFTSGKNYYNISTNSLSELLAQNIVSNATYSKTWEGSPFAFNANYYRDQNLNTGDIRERIPLINISMSETFPFESKSSSYNKKLYEYFSFSYSGSILNNNTKLKSRTSTNADTTISDFRSGVRNSLNFRLSPKFQFITFSPYLNYNEIWYNSYITKNFNPSDSSVTTTDNNAIKSLRYFSTGVSFFTKFVGIFSPRIFNMTGIRHTITPAITYVYQPDFSDPKWGYFNSYVDEFGKRNFYSIYEREVYGGAPSGESQSLAFTLGNLFEMKTRVNDSTENKFHLFSIDAGINYNFAADSLKFSPLVTSFRTNVGNYLNITGSATFNLYKYDLNDSARVNQFLINTDNILADLTSFNLSMSTSFNFGSVSGSNEKPVNPNDTLILGGDYVGIQTSKEDEVSFNIPVSGGLGFNYAEFKPTPFQTSRNSNLSGNLAFNLTEKWRLTFSTSYDILNGQIVAPYITAYRDLNSWELNFNWYPSGTYAGFSLEVRIKAPQLRDIKVSKQTNSRGVFN